MNPDCSRLSRKSTFAWSRYGALIRSTGCTANYYLGGVALGDLVVEVAWRTRSPRAATRLDGHPERDVRASLLLEELLDLASRRFGECDHGDPGVSDGADGSLPWIGRPASTLRSTTWPPKNRRRSAG